MKTKEKSQSKENTEPKLFENRELSWLSFNERVLEEAEAEENPLGEKLNFLSIFESNLDEFFMVRVGSLYDRMLLNDFDTENKTYLRPSEQIELIAKRVKKLAKRHAKAYALVMEALENENIKLVDFDHMEKKEAQYMQLHFQNEVLPLLSPVVVTKNNPLPFLENGDLYVASVLSKKGDKDKLGIIPCSGKALNRFVEVPGHKGLFYLTEELILHFLPMVYKAYTISDRAVIRITRNADIDADYVYDEELDYRELMESLINSRKRLSPVRLEYSRKLEKKTVDKLCDLLELNPVQAFLTERPLDLNFLSNIRNTLSDRVDLFYEKKTPQRSVMIDDRLPVIPQIRKKDVLLYYPYERMNPMIQLLEEAARDPETVSIEMTLYRLAKNSQIVAALCRAVEAGKKVTVLVELKARFDEENNIHWTHLLEDAGCEVFYGLNGYKVHSKLLLIKRKVDGKTEYIT